jgi:hypothetical protein
VPNLYTIDATREPPVIATEILQVLGSIGGSR